MAPASKGTLLNIHHYYYYIVNYNKIKKSSFLNTSVVVTMDQLIESALPADGKLEAKKYIHDNEIPRLFEVSNTLMYRVSHWRVSQMKLLALVKQQSSKIS